MAHSFVSDSIGWVGRWVRGVSASCSGSTGECEWVRLWVWVVGRVRLILLPLEGSIRYNVTDFSKCDLFPPWDRVTLYFLRSRGVCSIYNRGGGGGRRCGPKPISGAILVGRIWKPSYDQKTGGEQGGFWPAAPPPRHAPEICLYSLANLFIDNFYVPEICLFSFAICLLITFGTSALCFLQKKNVCPLSRACVDTPVHEGCAWQPRKELKHIFDRQKLFNVTCCPKLALFKGLALWNRPLSVSIEREGVFPDRWW